MSEHAIHPLRGESTTDTRRVEDVFTPHTPVSDPQSFCGRSRLVTTLSGLYRQRAQHVVVSGEHGTGKTSLVRTAAATVQGPLAFSCASTDEADTYTTLWHSAFTPLVGVAKLPASATSQSVTPAVALEWLRGASAEVPLTIVFDDFQNADEKVRGLMAETVRLVTEAFLPVTLVFCGIAESPAALFDAGETVGASRHEVVVPRMTDDERIETLTRAFGRVGVTAEDAVIERLAQLSLGLPMFLHALGAAVCTVAQGTGETTARVTHLERAVATVLESASTAHQESYLHATVRARRGIFPELLIACVLTAHAEDGTFLVGDVRQTLQRMIRREVRGLANQVFALTEEGRGSVCVKRGAGATATFRFVDATFEPYILLRGLEAGWTTGRAPEHLPGLTAELGDFERAA